MNDLQINIALAQAMGWETLSEVDFWVNDETGVYDGFKDVIVCQDLKQLRGWKVFDYRDPVIFVAICKHWGLVVNFRDGFASGIDGIHIVGEWEKPHFIEKAAALVAIKLAKRGVK